MSRFNIGLLALFAALASFQAGAQSPGLVYGGANGAPQPPKAAASSPSAIPAVVSPNAQTPVANAPQVALDPRRVDRTSTPKADGTKEASPGVSSSASSPSIASGRPAASPLLAGAQSPSSTPQPSPASPSGDAPSVSVRKLPGGGSVIRAQVPASYAEAEALVANQLPVPALKGPAAFVATPSPQNLGSSPSIAGLSDVKPLPKWAVQSMEKSSGKSQLSVSQGITEIIKIARNFPNRFVTPFEVAEVITTDEALTHDGVGGAVVVATSSDKPIGIFIQDRNSDRAISLVLIPEDIPQREIRLVLDDTWAVPVLRNQSESTQARQLPSAQADYVEHIKNIMRSLALGDVPEGHALANIQPELVPNCQMPGLNLRLGQMLEGSTTRIAVYVANNPNQSPVPVQEAGCYRKGVLAVSAFPRPLLEAGQSTEVYVVLRKETAAESASSAKRRPALVSN